MATTAFAETIREPEFVRAGLLELRPRTWARATATRDREEIEPDEAAWPSARGVEQDAKRAVTATEVDDRAPKCRFESRGDSGISLCDGDCDTRFPPTPTL